MRKKRKQFSYIELFCLAGFQILLFFVFLERVAEVDSMHKYETVLRIIFPPDKDDGSEFSKYYSGEGVLKEWKNKKKIFITIGLTGDQPEDEKRMRFVQVEARRLKYTYDTTHILKIHFTPENTYGQFIELVSIMQEDRHKRYMLYKDDFYILGESPPAIGNENQ